MVFYFIFYFLKSYIFKNLLILVITVYLLFVILVYYYNSVSKKQWKTIRDQKVRS